MTDELIEESDAVAAELVPMPEDAADVCPLCRSGRTSSDALCFSCQRTSGQVGHACPTVIPISFYTKPSPLRERMHDFKEHDDPEVRAAEGRVVAAILARYLLEHGSGLADVFGEWEAAVAVPSTNHNDPPALQTAIEDNFPDVLGPFARPLERGRGQMGFNEASETGFSLVEDVAGRRFLLLDDTFTTGARLQSAHHALVAGGATVSAAIVVTRKINPSEKYGSLDLWDRQSEIAFRFQSPPWWLGLATGE